jgi:sugar-specific transcriptional regulator TrmB
MDMVASMQVLDALKSIGLNLYERKIFVALLAKGIATAGEVSEIAKVPRSRSYDVLESLADKGFIILQPSKPIRYVALAPRDALERSKENLKKRHDERIERIDRLKASDIVKELECIYKQGFNLVQPFEMTGTLKGRHSINQQFNALLKKAKKSVSIMTTEDGLNDLYSRHFKTLKRASKNGIKIRIVAPIRDNKLSSDFSAVADIRRIEIPAGRVAIIDNEHMILALTDDRKVHQTQDTAFWANSSHATSDVMSSLFEQVWNSAK